MKIQQLFKPSNIRNFIEGNINIFKEKSSFMQLDLHIQEQAIYRAALCMECLDKGACTECGCITPHLFYAANKEDALLKWGKMLEEKEWEVFKEEHNLEIPDVDLAGIEVKNDFDLDILEQLSKWELRSIRRKVNTIINEAKG